MNSCQGYDLAWNRQQIDKVQLDEKVSETNAWRKGLTSLHQIIEQIIEQKYKLLPKWTKKSSTRDALSGISMTLYIYPTLQKSVHGMHYMAACQGIIEATLSNNSSAQNVNCHGVDYTISNKIRSLCYRVIKARNYAITISASHDIEWRSIRELGRG